MGEKGPESSSSSTATTRGGPVTTQGPEGRGWDRGGRGGRPSIERPNLESMTKNESLGFLDQLLGWGGEMVKSSFEDYSKEQLTTLIDAYMSGAVELVKPNGVSASDQEDLPEP